MSGNEVFELVDERGWVRGMRTMLRSGLAQWFKTRMWWIQCLIWGGMLSFLLGVMLFGQTDIDQETPLIIFAIFGGFVPAVGVIIIMQDALVGEKKDGTAAWVLSKPVTRPAFILSKLAANSLGVLVNMVLIPGGLAYALLFIADRAPGAPLRFLGVLGVMFLNHIFFLTLTLMLGTFFEGRGPVIGIALALLFLQQNLIGMVPVLRYVLPWNLAAPLEGAQDSLVLTLMARSPVQTVHWILAACVALESILFVVISVWRFNRQEL